ncbi:MAG: thiamine pyrophosphate-binding protein, partial [Anaerolineae bacterium]|nr:thiamine pyrophosphate-binding protein [Anaerolineae bacterium]
MSTVAQILAQTLAEAGIETVFGLPGGENSELMDALRQAGLRFVLVRNESSAVFMADVQARLTGKPGVALTTLGPGAANAYVGIAHAWLDRAPVLVITAQTPRRLLDHHTHQVLDTQAVMRPVTKHTEELTQLQVAARVRHALAITMDGRPGVVHLGLSSETAGLTAHDESAATPQPSDVTRSQSPVQQQQLLLIEDAFSKAKRPVLVLGLGLEPEQPYAELQRLAEALDAPVIVTPKAKGAVPDDHPLSAGVIGLTRSDPAYEILDEADLIIAVGFDVVELVKPWQQTAPLIWLAAWANVDPTIPAIAEFVGPVAPVLQQMATVSAASQANWGAQRVAAFRQKLAARALPSPQPGRLLPQTVLQIVRNATPRDIFVSTDVGSHKILSALTWPAYTPNRYMLSNGLSSVSYTHL